MSFIFPTKEANGYGPLVTELMKTTPVGADASAAQTNAT